MASLRVVHIQNASGLMLSRSRLATPFGTFYQYSPHSFQFLGKDSIRYALPIFRHKQFVFNQAQI